MLELLEANVDDEHLENLWDKNRKGSRWDGKNKPTIMMQMNQYVDNVAVKLWFPKIRKNSCRIDIGNYSFSRLPWKVSTHGKWSKSTRRCIKTVWMILTIKSHLINDVVELILSLTFLKEID